MGNKSNLFFTGIKHSGKTTFARLIAIDCNYAFSDSDDLITPKIYPLSIREFYKENGKEAFMALEFECVKAYIESQNTPFILSLGGGASDNTPLMEELRKNGKLVYLQREDEDMLPIIVELGIPPFLDENNVKGSFHELYERRDRIYRNFADTVINLGAYGDKNEKKLEIIKTLKELGYGL